MAIISIDMSDNLPKVGELLTIMSQKGYKISNYCSLGVNDLTIYFIVDGHFNPYKYFSQDLITSYEFL